MIDRLDRVPSYDEFLETYLLPNRPCILPPALISDWPILASWRHANGGVNWAHLTTLYGHLTAPCHPPGTPRPIVTSISSIQLGESVYMKDWHLSPCAAPFLFADDWMNSTPSLGGFRFVYAGSAGTSTPVHADVYTSYSWSTNIVGRKRWRLIPPSLKAALRRYPDVRTSQVASSSTISPSGAGWSRWNEASQGAIEVVQEEGETIFVPSDWWHEVRNETECISVNANWCNAVNLPTMYAAMADEVDDVTLSLEDVKQMMRQNGEGMREFTRTVQRVAEADAGWAWKGFWGMVEANLSYPPTEWRPKDEWVKERVRRLVQQFERREEYEWLEQDVKDCLDRCRALLL